MDSMSLVSFFTINFADFCKSCDASLLRYLKKVACTDLLNKVVGLKANHSNQLKDLVQGVFLNEITQNSLYNMT